MRFVSPRFKAIAGVAIATASLLLLDAPLAQQQVPKGNTASFQVVETSIDDIHAAYKGGRLTARQLTQSYLDRINAYNKQGPNINAIITLNSNALQDADKLDAAYRTSGFVGPLHGIPVLIKDEIDVAGLPTTLGSAAFKNYRPTKDAFVVDKLRKAGAIILGKTTLGEFALGDTYGSMFGITRNPYDPERTVGGSSGGSAASVNANFSTIALAEETGSSVRRPAGWNGLVGLRPTPGLVSRSGMWDGYPTEAAQMSPIARNVSDLAHLLDVMVGYDPEDPSTAAGLDKHSGSYMRFLDRNGLKGARIGILRESIGTSSDPQSEDFKKIDAVFEKNVAELKAAGATVIDNIEIPGGWKASLENLGPTGDPGPNDEAMRRYLARNPNSPFKTREDIAKAVLASPPYPNPPAPDVRNSAAWAKPLPAPDFARYGQYIKARDQLMTNILKVMADAGVDTIVHKTVEHQPSLINDGTNPPYVTSKGMPSLNTPLRYLAAITVPSGFTSDSLPVGITFVGRPYSEATLLRLAYSYEQATHHRAPPKTTPDLIASAPAHP
jgi:Asp-tRNA(Asn)/Glu-tRNA(Gln) amidotransferase A subunit family amidase